VRFIVHLAALLTTCLASSALGNSADAAERRKPNVIVMLIDDMGWTDLGCQGSTFYKTPNIDRLAAEGVRFTNAYSACTVCSPTRAALLTGQYPARLHITDWIAGHVRPNAKLRVPEWTKYLPHETTTIAEVLKSASYSTAMVGKWHLWDEAYWPASHGFDVNIGGNHRGQPPSYFFPYERGDIKLPGLEAGEEGEYLTDRLTDEAVAWIEANRDRPFFVYLPHYTVHTPLQAKQDLIDEYKTSGTATKAHNNATYAAMIDSLDQSVGRIMDKLRELKLDENTVVIFTSDNGGLIGPTSQPPLRAGKGSAYEGGVRVPLIVRFPGTVKAGTTDDTPVITMDLFPTIRDLASISPSAAADSTLDGISLLPLLDGSGSLNREALFWHYPHYHPGGATPYSAVRAGDHRLVEFFEDGRTELYNLKEDIGETKDLADEQPQKRDELRAMLAKWRESVGAQLPTPNPNYDPTAPLPAKGKSKNGQGKAKPQS
jgi:arylsulfatase A